MRGFFSFGRRKGPKSTANEPDTEASTAASEPLVMATGEPHRSLALPVLLAGLQGRSRPEILDLGPAQAANIEFLSALHARLTVEDLPATLAAGTAPPARLIQSLVANPPPTGFDTLFAWDLFDYLDTETLAILTARLGEISTPGAFLFALVAYRAEIPEQPQRFRLLDEQTVLYQPVSNRMRSAPRRTARDLGRLLAGFDVEGTYLLRNGYHEYLFVKR